MRYCKLNIFSLKLSYVIQNFYKPTLFFKNYSRLNLMIKYNKIFFLFTYYRMYLLFHNSPISLQFVPYFQKFFYSTFFFKQFLFFESLFSIKSRLHFTTKYHRTVHFYSLLVLSDLLRHQSSKKWQLLEINNKFIYSIYFKPLKVVFTNLHKKIYKPLFIFFMLISALNWPALANRYFYTNAFFFLPKIFKFLYFENIKIFRTEYL